MVLHPRARARVHREHHRYVRDDLGQRVEDARRARARRRRCRRVQGDQHERLRAAAVHEPEHLQQRPRLGSGISCTSVSIITFPTRLIDRGVGAFGEQVLVGVLRRGEVPGGQPIGHDAIDLVGHRRGRRERSPASTCPTGMPIFDAASEAASVELSRRTRARGRDAARAGIAPCPSGSAPSARAWMPDPTPRFSSGLRNAQLAENRVRHVRRRSAARCGRASAGTERRPSAAITGATFMKLGTAPTTWRMCMND